jgi:hypothetical protein
MHAETAPTITTTASAPCIAHGGSRVYSRACRSCTQFALDCFPASPAGTADDGEPAASIPADDLQAMQRDCAGSPCLSTGEARTFAGACRSCPAFSLWCFPARPAMA